MRILVTGKNGQLGKSIYNLVNQTKQDHEFVFVGRDELDFNHENSITGYFNNNNFDIIINCAAYTAVDKAEEAVEIANKINHQAVKQLAEIADKCKTKLIHISTDYVFDGQSDKAYTETDVTNPINIYGKTKLAGERVIQSIMPTNAIIIRVSWLYSEYSKNFVKSMLRISQEQDELNIVNDQVGSPTYATDLAKAILSIIKNKEFVKDNQVTKIYHYSNTGQCSWYEFSKEIFKLAKVKCKVNPITTNKYPTPAKRPKNTLMNKDKIVKKFGIEIQDWRSALNTCITRLQGKKQCQKNY
jgi:dTDP-4-dehydrorhamnose reductase